MNNSRSPYFQELTELLGQDAGIRSFVPASKLTTFSLGGMVATVVYPQSLSALGKIISYLEKKQVPWRILGNGSNVLITDDVFQEVVVCLGRAFSGYTFLTSVANSSLVEEFVESRTFSPIVGDVQGEEVRMLVLGSSSLLGLSRETARAGLSGLEFAAGIPATIGGAIKMNAGAHGTEIAQVVEKVFLLDESRNLTERTKDSLGFGYRHSLLAEKEIVVAVELKLCRLSVEEVEHKRAAALSYRQETQPLQLPSAGSVFRNPEGFNFGDGLARTAGALLETVGLKGYRLGGVEYSKKHANWIVKIAEEARASQVTDLIEFGQKRVLEEFGVSLKSEIIVWQ